MSEASRKKRPDQQRRRAASEGRVVLNVGGTLFTTSKTTLVGSSAYFESLFSDKWTNNDGDDEEDIFIDQDPEAFRVLLSYMRLGKVKASELTTAVLLQAQFLGMEKLLEAVRLAVRREVFAGKTKMLLNSAKSAGLLDGSEEIQKEYAVLSTYFYADCSFRVQQQRIVSAKEIVASIQCGDKSDDGSPVKLYSTFIDCLNWLHRNRYVLEEETLSKEDKDFRCPSFYFSRLSELEGGDDLASTIVSPDHDTSAVDQREFASMVEFSPDHTGLLYVEAAFGQVEERELVGQLSGGANLAKVQTKRKEDMNKVALMHWLQQEGYTRREPSLENIYLHALCYASCDGENSEPLDPSIFSLALWSRQMRGKENNAD